MYLSLLKLLDNHPDVLRDHLLVGLSTETSIDFCNLLMTSSSSSGDCSISFSSTRWTSSVWPNSLSFQPAVTISHLELICHHFDQLSDTSLSSMITRIGFWDSRICVPSWVPSLTVFLYGSLGPASGSFSSRVLSRVSSNQPLTPWSLLVNLPLTPWLKASLSALLPSPAAIGSLFRAPSTRSVNASLALL